MKDIDRIRELARATREFAMSSEMERRRKLWTEHNSLHFTIPPIYTRSIPLREYLRAGDLRCQDAQFRNLEYKLLLDQYYMRLCDDTITEPYITVRAAVDIDPVGVYGLPADLAKKLVAAGYQIVTVEELFYYKGVEAKPGIVYHSSYN